MKKQVTHSASPWKICTHDKTDYILSSNGSTVVEFADLSYPREADIKLIIMAPELLKTLKEIVNATDDILWAEKLQNIIDKTEDPINKKQDQYE